MNDEFEYISYEIDQQVATITLDRPEKRNALSTVMIREISAAIKECNENDTIEVIVIKSAIADQGIFSAGIDLVDLGKHVMAADTDQFASLITNLQNQYNAIANSRLPTIAVIDGLCLGAAMELVLACDFRIATPDTQLALNETQFGIIPDLGGTTRLIRLTNMQVAKRMIMLAHRISAQQALQDGIVDWVAEETDIKLKEIINYITSNSSSAVQRAKQLIMASVDLITSESLKMDGIAQQDLVATGEPVSRIQSFMTTKK